MKNIVVMPNSYKDPGYRYSRQVISYLEQHGAHIFLSASLRNEISVDSIEYYDGKIPREAEMILVIGGDGSVLRAAHLLDETAKEVFLLRTCGERDFASIGELFGKTASWARVTYHRAKVKVLETIQEKEGTT